MDKLPAYNPPENKRGYGISLLVDDPQAWIMPWANRLLEILKDHHEVELVNDSTELRQGDFAFLLGCTKLTPMEVLARHRHNLVVHESRLPQGKGFAPLAWQVLEGARSIPVTLFEAVDEPDAGPVYLRDAIALDGTELLPELRHKQGLKTLELILEFLTRWPELEPEPQQGEDTYYPRRTKADDRLDPEQPLSDLFDHLRVVDNERYPAWFEFRGQRYFLHIHKMDEE